MTHVGIKQAISLTQLSGDVYTVEHSERGRESHVTKHPPQGLPGPVQRVLRERRSSVGVSNPKVKFTASLRVWFSRVNAWGGVVYPHKTRGEFMYTQNVTRGVTPEAGR